MKRKEYIVPMKYVLGGQSRGTAYPGVRLLSPEPNKLDRPKSPGQLRWVMGNLGTLNDRYPNCSFTHIVRTVYGGWIDKSM